MGRLLMFLGMALATYFTRYAMIAVLDREVPPLLRRWLRHVPPAMLAALVVPAALAPQGHLDFNTHTWIVLVGGVLAWRTRSVLWTILGGIVAFWMLNLAGL